MSEKIPVAEIRAEITPDTEWVNRYNLETHEVTTALVGGIQTSTHPGIRTLLALAKDDMRVLSAQKISPERVLVGTFILSEQAVKAIRAGLLQGLTDEQLSELGYERKA